MTSKGFKSFNERPLEQDLNKMVANRLNRSDIERKSSIPFEIGSGARLAGTKELDYFANGSAGTWTATVDLDLKTVPVVSAWFLGAKDKDGVIVDDNALQLSGVYAGSVFGASATGGLKFTWDKSAITFTMLSANVGWPSMVAAYIYYTVFYDETEVSQYGL